MTSFESCEVDVAAEVEAAIGDPLVYGVSESVYGSANEPWVVVVA